jgi:hypothetical protein
MVDDLVMSAPVAWVVLAAAALRWWLMANALRQSVVSLLVTSPAGYTQRTCAT